MFGVGEFSAVGGFTVLQGAWRHPGPLLRVPLLACLQLGRAVWLVQAAGEQSLSWVRTTALAYAFFSLKNIWDLSSNEGFLVAFNKFYFNKEGVLNNYKVLFLEEAETNLTTLFHV